MITQDEIRERVEKVRKRISDAAIRAGREPSSVKLVAVTKTHSADVVRLALNCGMADFGENRVQESDGKISEIGRRSAVWHLIGHLQANKAKRAVALFDVIHSVDSISLARRLDRICDETGRKNLEVLIQVDLGGEATKSGIDVTGLPELLNTIASSRHLDLLGLMTLPPFFDDPEKTRPFFCKLREIRDNHKEAFIKNPAELSMGMTNDFEVAIEEGATIVRVGTAIFGERERYNPA